MDWLTALLKHLSIARSAVVALLVTSAAIYVGPRVVPDYFDPLPQQWSIVVVGVFIFSSCLVIFWGLSYAWAFIKEAGGSLSTNLSARCLNDLELTLLLLLARRPTESFDLESVNYEKASFTHLEFLQVAYQLERKGLVCRSYLGPNHFTLSENGRKRALVLQRQIKTKAT